MLFPDADEYNLILESIGNFVERLSMGISKGDAKDIIRRIKGKKGFPSRHYIKMAGYRGSYDEKQEYTLPYTWQPMTAVTPTPPDCKSESIGLSPARVKLIRKKSIDVTVTVKYNCLVEATMVTATVIVGKKRISFSPPSQLTDEDGAATFTITARDTIGRAKVIFTAEMVYLLTIQ